MKKSKDIQRVNKILKLYPFGNTDVIRKEIFIRLAGFELTKTNKNQGEFDCTFVNESKDSALLTVTHDCISLYKSSNGLVEIMKINESLKMSDEIVLKKEEGLVYRTVSSSYTLEGKIPVIVESLSRSFSFSNETFSILFSNINQKDSKLTQYLFGFQDLDREKDLSSLCDLYTESHNNGNFNMRASDSKNILKRVKENI